jgi:hypothetical protein
MPNKLLEQNIMANVLMFASLMFMAECALASVPAIMEHPAYTQYHLRFSPQYGYPASIWRTDQMKLLLRIGKQGPATIRDELHLRMITVKQGEFGCTAQKPTTFLVSTIPMFDELHQHMRLPRRWRKEDAMTGTETVNGRVTFKTARAKEYPSQLCALLATALVEGSQARTVLPRPQPTADVVDHAYSHRALERAMGKVEMGADYAPGASNNAEWNPVSPDAVPPPWMPAYPDTAAELVAPPTTMHIHYPVHEARLQAGHAAGAHASHHAIGPWTAQAEASSDEDVFDHGQLT